jgi:signal transduction histidine kinase/ActR/RegA family two-component response regulator
MKTAEDSGSGVMPAQAAMVRWFLETTHQGLFATDADFQVLAWNRWMQIHTGRPASDVVGRPLFEAFPELVTRELDRCYRDALEGRVTTLSQGLHRYVLPLAPTHADLGLPQMPQSGQIGPLMDGDRVIGTVTTIDNVSDRLGSEAELRKQIEAHRLARSAAEDALRSKDEFLSTLSHELRQPLNAVLGWTRILMARQDTDQDAIARALRVIDRNAMAQAAMIDDILDVARVVAGKLRLELRPTDLLQVVLAAVDVITPSATAKRIVITTTLDAATPLVLGDAARLQQIVWNLLSNAVKFTDLGGTIDIRLSPAGALARLVVADSGLGIAPGFLPFVFDRFRQSDASSTRRQGGLGLGLALARDLVELHGGTIRAASDGAQKGATFTIDLPTVVSHEPAGSSVETNAPAADGVLLTGIRALVVDDDTDARELLVAVLVSYGAEVVSARSSDEALGLLREAAAGRPFDVILSDIGMPKNDGYELIRRVRSLDEKSGGKIPAVAVTGYANPNDRDRTLEAGYQVHVPKPIDPKVLAAAIESTVRRNQPKLV